MVVLDGAEIFLSGTKAEHSIQRLVKSRDFAKGSEGGPPGKSQSASTPTYTSSHPSKKKKKKKLIPPAGSANPAKQNPPIGLCSHFIPGDFYSVYLPLSAAPLARPAQQQTDRNALRASSNLLAAAARSPVRLDLQQQSSPDSSEFGYHSLHHRRYLYPPPSICVGGLAAPPVPKGPAAKRNGGKQPARIQSGGGIGFHPLDKLPPIGFFLPFVGAPPSRCWCGGRAARARNWKAGATGSSVWFAGVRFSRMGAIMCCFRGPRDDAPGCCCLPWPFLNNIHNNNSNHNSGAPARPRAPSRVAPVQERVPPAGSRQDDSMNTFRCPPRPLPYDDPQFRHQTEHHPLVSGHDKASTQSQKSILLEESNDAATRSTCADEKADGPSLKADSGGKKVGGAQVCVPSDCEDDCPICLEEYDYENPKIVLQCNHNFHLSCIYEWMERSQSCAVCAKVMLFKEGQ